MLRLVLASLLLLLLSGPALAAGEFSPRAPKADSKPDTKSEAKPASLR